MLDALGRAGVAADIFDPKTLPGKAAIWFFSTPWWVPALLATIMIAAMIWLLSPPAPAPTPHNSPVKTAPSPVPSSVATGSFSWQDAPGLSYKSEVAGTVFLALLFIGRNIGATEVAIEDAYLISGITGERKDLEIEISGGEKVAVSDVNPIPSRCQNYSCVRFLSRTETNC
jgi:hypothetical protein